MILFFESESRAGEVIEACPSMALVQTESGLLELLVRTTILRWHNDTC
jgi:hypothetical protein